jgi:uncharacterized Fe-S cluster-containing radical SAM superfamily protein
MSTAVLLDLVEVVGRLPPGLAGPVTVRSPEDVRLVETWCARHGHDLVERRPDAVIVRRKGLADPLAGLPAGHRPGWRLWLYTNYDCNLACDYCCVRSSPQTARRALGLDRIRRLMDEAPAAGVGEVFLTGGEPFLLPDIADIVGACVAALPTTLLTNGMLFRGRRLDALRSLPREGLALQISIDSPTPGEHDRHRGAGTWRRAVEGVRVALAEGFRVRVAATVGARDPAGEEAFHAWLGELGIPRHDRVIRRIARRGAAEEGVAVTEETLIPEVTVSADGVYWHPVAADDEDTLVTREVFPLARAIEQVRKRFVEHRSRQDAAASVFPCA